MNPVDAILGAIDNSSPFGQATVLSLLPATDAQPRDMVLIRWYGSSQVAEFVKHYTPAAGHVVLVAKTQPLTVLGKY